jgi:hypothetical protein
MTNDPAPQPVKMKVPGALLAALVTLWLAMNDAAGGVATGPSRFPGAPAHVIPHPAPEPGSRHRLNPPTP